MIKLGWLADADRQNRTAIREAFERFVKCSGDGWLQAGPDVGLHRAFEAVAVDWRWL